MQLESLIDVFHSEDITLDVLMDMTSNDLKSVGVSAFGKRHKILKKVREIRNTGTDPEVKLSTIYFLNIID